VIDEALADGEVTEEEEAAVIAIIEENQLPEDIAVDVIEEIMTAHEESKDVREEVVEDTIEVLEDSGLGEETAEVVAD